MELIRSGADSRPGPEEWFTGAVWLDEVASARPPSRVQVLNVHFSPGARTAWHRHPFGQVLHVTGGEGLAQRRGGPIEAIRAGDTLRFEPDEEHWHGGSPTRLMAHVAIQEADDDGIPTYWGDHVSDDEYLSGPAAR